MNEDTPQLRHRDALICALGMLLILGLVIAGLRGAPPAPAPAQPMPAVAHVYRATVVSVHDGDSLALDIELETHAALSAQPLRLEEVYAVELSRPGGTRARDNLRALLPPGCAVIVRLRHTATGSNDATFGRIVGRVWRESTGADVNAAQAAWLQEQGLWGGTGTESGKQKAES